MVDAAKMVSRANMWSLKESLFPNIIYKNPGIGTLLMVYQVATFSLLLKVILYVPRLIE
jgi:hypothetical protein